MLFFIPLLVFVRFQLFFFILFALGLFFIEVFQFLIGATFYIIFEQKFLKFEDHKAHYDEYWFF